MATASWPTPGDQRGSPDEEEDDDLSKYTAVCSLDELQRLGKKKFILKERVMVIFYVEGKAYALDHFCYHTGGPLELGDIEVGTLFLSCSSLACQSTLSGVSNRTLMVGCVLSVLGTNIPSPLTLERASTPPLTRSTLQKSNTIVPRERSR